MNPIKAQRTWYSLSSRWINATPFGRGKPYKTSRRMIKTGVLSNLIPVEVVNAITGEVHKGYMRDISLRKLRKWLGHHNSRAQVEQVSIPPKSTFKFLNKKDGGLKEFPILIKLGKYQVPYLIEHVRLDIVVRKKQTFAFNLKVVDNLKYLELVAEKKVETIKLFNKIKKAKKK
jgi:hypothetical protein